MKTGINGEVLRIENLSFAYEKGVTVLKDISLTAHEGESIGVIGAME